MVILCNADARTADGWKKVMVIGRNVTVFYGIRYLVLISIIARFQNIVYTNIYSLSECTFR